MANGFLTHTLRRKKYLFDLALLGLCAVALYYGIRATSDLMVPNDADQYRDIGLAQTILDTEKITCIREKPFGTTRSSPSSSPTCRA